MATKVNSESFQSSSADWSWNTPGSSEPEDRWSRGDSATPTGSSGPNGGAEPLTRAVVPGDGFAYTEATLEGTGPWSLESPELDASEGPLTLNFDCHMRFGQAGKIRDGTLEVQGWNGTAWSRIGGKIVGSKQSTADSAYRPSSDFDTYDSSAFSNPGFKFRLLFSRGTSQFSSNYDCAVDNCVISRKGATVMPNPNPNRIPSGVRTIWIDQKNGKPQHDGSSPAKAKKTIKAGIKALKPGNALVVRKGTYYERLAINNLGKKTRIMAEKPGTVTISGLWKDADQGKVTWKKKEGGVFTANHGDSFMGSFGDEFLFRYKSVGDLKKSEIVGVKKPAHGFAVEGGKIHIRLPNDKNPNRRSIKLTDKPNQTIIDIRNCPNITIDGFVIEGAGNADAIKFDQKSNGPVIRNCKFTHSRRAARLPHGAIFEWSEYTYTGFYNFVDALLDRNGGDTKAIFRLVKNYWAEHGNAALEGGLAESIHKTGSKNCEFRFNFCHELFDGERLGAFVDSESHHNVYLYNYDNHIEFESWNEKRSCKNLRVHHSLFLDCGAGPLSHQDKSGGMKGPHYVSHCVIDNRDRKHSHPPFLIKILNLKGTVAYYHCLMRQVAGNNRGFGKANAIAMSMMRKKLDGKLKIRNCLIIGDGLTDTKGQPDYDGNLVIDKKAGVDNIGKWLGKNPDVLKLGEDYRLLDGSPAIGKAKKLPNDWPWPLPGGRSGDVGPFAKGVAPGKDWPRPMRTVYSDEPV